MRLHLKSIFWDRARLWLESKSYIINIYLIPKVYTMKKNKLLLISILCVFTVSYSSNKAIAFSWDPKNFSEYIRVYIDENYSLVNQFPIYNTVRNKVSERIVQIDKTDTEKRQYLKDLMFYNNTNILRVVRYITSREWALERFTIWKQKAITKLQKKEANRRSNLWITKKVIYIDQNNEFSKNNDIYRLSFKNPELVSSENYDTFSQKEWSIIFKDWVGLMYSQDIDFERKIPFEEIIKQWDHKFLFYSDNYFWENWNFYTYEYDEYFTITTNYWVYKSDIEKDSNTYEDAIFLRLQDAKNNIAFFPKKRKITNDSYFNISSLQDKEFINSTSKDVLRSDKDYDKDLEYIYELWKRLGEEWENTQEKIKNIYDWMIQNVSYPEEYNLTDYKYFSWIESYINGQWLCEGQAQLMYYLLKAAGIENVEIISWYVVDSPDFPKVWHAWIQIWDYFYDPSFETNYKEKSSEYLYYRLPFDIAYTNRYNSRDIPETLFQEPRENIEKEVNRRRFELTKKYSKNQWYSLLKEFHEKKKYSLTANDTLNLNHIYNSLPRYDLEIKNWQLELPSEIFLEDISYYEFFSKDEDISSMLKELDYSIEKYVIINIYEWWILKSYGITDSLQSNIDS